MFFGVFTQSILRPQKNHCAPIWRLVSGAVASRFRLTGSGKIKRKSSKCHHNTGLKRPRVATRKRQVTELKANPKIRNTYRKLLLSK